MFTAEGLEPFTDYHICLAASNQYTQVDEGVSLERRVHFMTTEGSKCVCVCVCVCVCACACACVRTCV